jgi:hypothetical protein
MTDRVRAGVGEHVMEDPGTLTPNGRFDLDERSPVELKDKQVQVHLWASRKRPADGSGRDPAHATGSD